MWKRRNSIPHGTLTAFIDESSELEGRYSFTGTVLFHGRLKGAIDATGTLVVGASAIIHAGIRSRVVLVDGEVVGDIVASERVELRKGARVFGDVETPALVVEEGVTYDGQTRMTKPALVEGSPPPQLALVAIDQ